MNTIKSYATYCPECFNHVREEFNTELASVGARLSREQYKEGLMDKVESQLKELEKQGCYRDCLDCDERFITEEASSIDRLQAEFNEGITYGTQLDALDNWRGLVADEFARQPEAGEKECPEYDERSREMEMKFDEWWTKNENSPRVKFEIGEQCKNFLAAIRKRYVKVGMVRMMTDKMNSRERSHVWGAWKGWNSLVYGPMFEERNRREYEKSLPPHDNNMDSCEY